MRNQPELPVDAEHRTQTGRWLAIAVGVLVLAGLFAAALVVGRTPPLDRWVGDPGLFRRCLVVHVDLSLVVWFYAFAAALFGLVPRRTPPGRLARAAPFVAAFGVGSMVVASAVPAARPVLSNYIPMIDHGAFGAGLAAFAASVLASTSGMFSRAGGTSLLAVPPAAIAGLRATALALWLSALTFALSWARRTEGLAIDVHYELLFWGTGHVLALASTGAMLSSWLVLLGSAGRSPLSPRGATGLFGALLLPWVLFAPALALAGTSSSAYREGFTNLMQLGIAPAVAVAAVLAVRDLRGALARREVTLGHPGVVAFAASALLTGLGFVLGALIRGSTTMVPAHYHANIGAVTASFMGVAWVVLAPLGVAVPARHRALAAAQPALYALGQGVFAIGFGLAGAHGTMRKAYGAEQHARGLAETFGLAVMGLGGLVAISAGLLFLYLVVNAWRAADGARVPRDAPAEEPRSRAWIEMAASHIPSRD